MLKLLKENKDRFYLRQISETPQPRKKFCKGTNFEAQLLTATQPPILVPSCLGIMVSRKRLCVVRPYITKVRRLFALRSFLTFMCARAHRLTTRDDENSFRFSPMNGESSEAVLL